MNTKSLFIAAFSVIIALNSYSQETVTDTGNRIVKGNLTVEGTTALSNLVLPSSKVVNGWKYTYLKYPGHSLVVGPSKGGYANTRLEIVPGTSTKEACNSAFLLYSSDKEENLLKKVVLASSGLSYFNGGSVGIGTDNPQYLLDVNGTSRSVNQIVNGDLSVGGSTSLSDVTLQHKEAVNGWKYTYLKYPGHSLMIGPSKGGYADTQIDIIPGTTTKQNCNSRFILYSSDKEENLLKKVVFNSSGSSFFNGGNVGIGTETPQNKLDVQGTIRATEVKVETGWADFVFADDYKLPTLKEVEAHITEHRHLPGIPSEAEVKAEGVSLGDMQAKLLQKIEELTLYVIELEKKVNRLENSK